MTTNIEWVRNPDGTKGKSWPVVTGCSHAGGPGCDMCYAARMAATRLKHHPRYEGLATIENGKARWTGKINLNHDVLEQPLHWRKPRMVFIASMSDLFHPSVPRRFVSNVFEIINQAPQHIFQILTKRPQRMLEYIRWWEKIEGCSFDLNHVWLGVSVENQAAADERIPWLLQIPAAVRYVSVEPMLSAVDLWSYLDPDHYEPIYYSKPNPTLSWVICGGESGPDARPMHPNWARSLRDQCQAAGAPFFFKQWGAWLPLSQRTDQQRVTWARETKVHLVPGGESMQYEYCYRVGKKRAGRLLDGQVWDQFPVSVPGQS